MPTALTIGPAQTLTPSQCYTEHLNILIVVEHSVVVVTEVVVRTKTIHVVEVVVIVAVVAVTA